MPTFSVLIANYNNGKYFKDCYNSLIQQTYPDWEAVIVDDCSTDDSVQVIQEMISGDPRFRLILSDKNHGVGYTKNKAAAQALGTYMGVLDPDDGLLPKALETVVNHLQSHPEHVGVCTKSWSCDQDLNISEKPLYGFETMINHPYQYLHNGLYTIHHFFAFTKAAYTKTPGIDNTLRNGDDIDLYLKMEEQGDIYCSNDFLHLYRSSPGGLSQGHSSTPGIKTQKYSGARCWYWVLQVFYKNGTRRIATNKWNFKGYLKIVLERLIFTLKECKRLNDRETFDMVVKEFFEWPSHKKIWFTPLFLKYYLRHKKEFIW